MAKTSLEEIELFHNQCTLHQLRDLTVWDLRVLLKCMDAFDLEHSEWFEDEEEALDFDRLYCKLRETYTFLYIRNYFEDFQKGREIETEATDK